MIDFTLVLWKGIKMQCKEDELLLYACERFERGEYDAALEAFILVYQKGYEQHWVLDNIYRCYMAANEERFRKSYEKWNVKHKVAYEECTLDFIPYRDGEYYIYDKELAVFRGIFSIHELEEAQQDSAFENVEFSAAALVLNWDWRGVQGNLTTAKERNIYIVCYDAGRCLSFWKIPELREYLEHIKVFFDFEEFQAYFHENTSEYLPKVFCGNEKERECLLKIENEEHKYRLTPEGRSTENVLLTIAIPTTTRGNMLLKRIDNLLPMPYDAEIEIAISKNGNKFFETEYKQVSMIPDARIKYFDHVEELSCIYNWHYAIEMSNGKYVMLISDEDDVFIDKLEHYLKILSSYPDLCMVRPKSTDQYRLIDKRTYGKKGQEAFDLVFLRQSHFSGMIVRRHDFIEADLLSLEKYTDNMYYRYYPHEWWWMILSQKGDCMNEPVLLFDDSHPINHEEEVERLGTPVVQEWKTFETRIEQFKGMIDFLQFILKIDDKMRYEKLLHRAINKIVHFFRVAVSTGYIPENYKEMIEQFMVVCIDVIEKSFLDTEQKISLLYRLNNYCLVLYEIVSCKEGGNKR